MRKVTVTVGVVLLLLFILTRVASAQVKVLEKDIYQGLDLGVVTGRLEYLDLNQDRMTVVAGEKNVDIDIHRCTRLPQGVQVGQVIAVLLLLDKEEEIYHKNVTLALDVVQGQSYTKDHNRVWREVLAECEDIFKEGVRLLTTRTFTFIVTGPETSRFTYRGYVRLSRNRQAIITATSVSSGSFEKGNERTDRLVALVDKDTEFKGTPGDMASISGSIIIEGGYPVYIAKSVAYKSEQELFAEEDEFTKIFITEVLSKKREIEEYKRLLEMAGTSVYYTYYSEGNVVKLSAQDISVTCYLNEEELLNVTLPSKIEQNFQRIVAGAGYNLAFDITGAFFNAVAKHTTIQEAERMPVGEAHCLKAFAAVIGTIKAINQGKFSIVRDAIGYFLKQYKEQDPTSWTTRKGKSNKRRR